MRKLGGGPDANRGSRVWRGTRSTSPQAFGSPSSPPASTTRAFAAADRPHGSGEGGLAAEADVTAASFSPAGDATSTRRGPGRGTGPGDVQDRDAAAQSPASSPIAAAAADALLPAHPWGLRSFFWHPAARGARKHPYNGRRQSNMRHAAARHTLRTPACAYLCALAHPGPASLATPQHCPAAASNAQLPCQPSPRLCSNGAIAGGGSRPYSPRKHAGAADTTHAAAAATDGSARPC